MSKKRKDLTTGMVVTKPQKDCRMFMDDAGCWRTVLVCTDPNPADWPNPIVKYLVNGVEVPRPEGDLEPCPEPGTMRPVYVMGGKLDLGEAVSVDLGSLETLLTQILEEQRKDTPFNKTRYCNAVTGTWWEKLCVVEKQVDGSYQAIVVSDEDTFGPCEQNASGSAQLVCLKSKIADTPNVQGWATFSVNGSGADIKIYSLDGSELSLTDYEIVGAGCC